MHILHKVVLQNMLLGCLCFYYNIRYICVEYYIARINETTFHDRISTLIYTFLLLFVFVYSIHNKFRFSSGLARMICDERIKKGYPLNHSLIMSERKGLITTILVYTQHKHLIADAGGR